jgi:hypothetical protein
MSEKEKLLAELDGSESLFNASRRDCKWDEAQAAAMTVMNLCRRLALLEIQEKQEAAP